MREFLARKWIIAVARNMDHRNVVRNHLCDVNYLGMMILLRYSELGPDRRNFYDHLCNTIVDKFATQMV